MVFAVHCHVGGVAFAEASGMASASKAMAAGLKVDSVTGTSSRVLARDGFGALFGVPGLKAFVVPTGGARIGGGEFGGAGGRLTGQAVGLALGQAQESLINRLLAVGGDEGQRRVGVRQRLALLAQR